MPRATTRPHQPLPHPPPLLFRQRPHPIIRFFLRGGVPKQPDEAAELAVARDACFHAAGDLVGLQDFGGEVGVLALDDGVVGDGDEALDGAASEAALAEELAAAEGVFVLVEEIAEGVGLAVNLFDGGGHAAFFAPECAAPLTPPTPGCSLARGRERSWIRRSPCRAGG